MKSKKKRRQLFALLLCVMLALNVVLSASASEIVDGTTGTIETTEEPSVEAEKEAPEEKTKASQEEKEVPQEEAEALQEETEVPQEEAEAPQEETKVQQEETEVKQEEAQIPQEEIKADGEDAETEQEEENVPESADEPRILEYEDDDVRIHLTATKSALLNVAELRVTPMKENNEETQEKYVEIAEQIDKKAAEESKKVLGFFAYDITLLDAEGNETEPEGMVKVFMEYKEASIPETVSTEDTEAAKIMVIHHIEDAEGVVEEALEATVTTTDQIKIEKAEFVTDSFSVFTILWLQDETELDELSMSDQEAEPLTTVETVDHEAAGIVMKMTNYSQGGESFYGLGGEYGNGTIKPGLVKNVLVDGYPVAKNGSQRSLKNAFANGTNVNHLFIKETYDTSGYYEYSSFENYAYLENTDFTVYRQLGTPYGYTDPQHYFFQRGNFLPYNPIEAGEFSGNTNLYDEYGTELDQTHPRYNEKLYQTQGETDYYFGMYMEVPFVQPKEGLAEFKEQRSPMRYEFNGDDDLWVFIDEVLVLDIGGIHDAHSGYIDFSTGEVGWYDCETGDAPVLSTTTIKAMFQKAGIFPDGTSWKAEKVNEYFTGNTFSDYTAHTLKMFYMERGAGASNLHIKFNIPAIPKGTFDISKELTNTDKEKYANVQFAFQAFAQKIISVDENTGVETYDSDEYVPLTSAVYKGTDTPITFLNDQTFDDVSYDNVFYLKSGETARFSGLQENRKYYLSEIGVHAKEFDKVVINGVGHKEYTEEEQSSGIIDNVETARTEVSKRPLVVYENNCSVYNSRELRITKEMKTGQTTEDTFTFQILLENRQGALAPYVGSYYMQDSGKNYYYYENGELRNNGTEAIVCGTSTAEGLISGIGAGYTIIVTQILSGTEFQVTEVNYDTAKYKIPVKTLVEGAYDTASIDGADGAIKLGEDAKVVITNALKIEKQWQLLKKSSDGKLLEGAKFQLEPVTESTSVYYGLSQKDDGKVIWYTDENCSVPAEIIGDGTYEMTELQAPAGYAVSNETWTVVMSENMPVITMDDTVISPEIEMIEGDDVIIEVHTYYYENEVLYELPSTGGMGTCSYLVGGIICMLGAAYALFENGYKCKKYK